MIVMVSLRSSRGLDGWGGGGGHGGGSRAASRAVATDQGDVDGIRDAHGIERRKTGKSESERPQTGKKWRKEAKLIKLQTGESSSGREKRLRGPPWLATGVCTPGAVTVSYGGVRTRGRHD